MLGFSCIVALPPVFLEPFSLDHFVLCYIWVFFFCSDWSAATPGALLDSLAPDTASSLPLEVVGRFSAFTLSLGRYKKKHPNVA